jgi:hypothetical protein
MRPSKKCHDIYIGKETSTATPLNVNFNATTPVLIQFRKFQSILQYQCFRAFQKFVSLYVSVIYKASQNTPEKICQYQPWISYLKTRTSVGLTWSCSLTYIFSSNRVPVSEFLNESCIQNTPYT